MITNQKIPGKWKWFLFLLPAIFFVSASFGVGYGFLVNSQTKSVQERFTNEEKLGGGEKPVGSVGKVRGVSTQTSGSVKAVQDDVTQKSLAFRLKVFFFDSIQAVSGIFDTDLKVGNNLTVGNDFEVTNDSIIGNTLTVRGKLIIADDIEAPNIINSITAGTGILVSGDNDVTITNSDGGSAQNIFKNIKIDSTTISASSNTDTITFESGTGISLSSSGKTVTVATSGSDNVSGWFDDGTVVRLVTSTDNVGIGTTSPTSKLHVVGSGNISGATTLGDTLGVTGATTLSSTLGVTGISTFSSNVGIGSESPAYTLDLVGEFNLTDAIRVAGDAGTTGYFLTSSAGGAMTWTDPNSLAGTTFWSLSSNVLHPKNEYASVVDLTLGGTSTTSADIHLYSNGAATFNEQGAEVDFRVEASAKPNAFLVKGDTGRIGLGVSPSYTLDLVGEFNLTDAIRSAGDAGTSGYLLTSSGGGAMTWTNPTALGDGSSIWANTANAYHPFNEYADVADLILGGNSTASANIHLYSNGEAVFNEQGNDSDFRIEASGQANAFFVQGSDGNVGIGTSSPRALLEIANSSVVEILLGGDTGVGEIQSDQDINFTIDADNDGSNHAFKFLHNLGTELARITDTGSLGIGSTSPTGKLNVSGAATGKALTILNQTGDQAILVASSSSGTNRFIIANDGNVGIGSAAPGYTLDLVGEFNLTDAIRSAGDAGTSGYLLTSSGGGAMAWTAPASLGDGSSIWTNTLNVYHPFNEYAAVADLALGGISTASANVLLRSDGQGYFGGNLGIGSATPGYALDVVGEFNLSDAVRVAGDAGTSGYVLTSSGGGAMTWTNPVSFGDGSSIWANSANVYHPLNEFAGVVDLVLGGVSTASANIHLYADGSAIFNEQGNDADFRVEASGQTHALFVQGSDGFVGIGSATPGYTLDLVGEFNLTDAIRVAGDAGTSGYLLTSSAGGAMTWSNPTSLADGPSIWTNTANVYHPYNEYASVVDLVIGGTATTSADIQLYSDGSAVFNEQGNDADFRIEAVGQANALLVQGSDGNIGIGSATPGYKLDVNGSLNLSSANTFNIAGTQMINYSSVADSTIFFGNGGATHGANDDNNTSVGIGALAGLNNTTGIRNVAVGYNALNVNAAGDNNVAMGYLALVANTSGGGNIAIGSSAGASVTTGSNNIAIGLGALDQVSGDRYDNIAIGADALGGATMTSRGNVAIGVRALDVVTNGISNSGLNTAVGSDAGGGNTSGVNNIYLGSGAGQGNTSGSTNIYVGFSQTGAHSGDSNIIMGNSAASGALTGDDNIIFGRNAGNGVTGATSNFLAGYRAGHGISTGDYNTIFGYEAFYNAASANGTGNENIVIGMRAGETLGGTSQFNTIIGGHAGNLLPDNSSGNVMIGYSAGALETDATGNKLYINNSNSATPLIYGDFTTKELIFNGSPAGTVTASETLSIVPTFGINAADQILMGLSINPNTNSNTDAGDTLYAGYFADITGTAATEYGLRIGTGYDTGLYVESLSYFGANVGIGSAAPGAKLNVVDDAADYVAEFFNDGNATTRTGLLIQVGEDAPSGTNTAVTISDGDGTTVGSITFDNTQTFYNTSSDRKLKENITASAKGLNDLLKIKIHDYNFITDAKKQRIQGVIAQELYEVYSQAVSRPSDVNGYWSVDYGKLTPLLVQSVQDQQAQVVGLSLKLNETGLLIDQMGQVLGEVQQDSDQQEEKSIKELLNYYTTLSDIAWTFVSEVIFNAKAKFMASVEFVKDVTFNGSVRLSKESAGTVVIPANTTKAKIAFDRVFSQVPNVYLTNKDQFSGNLSIAEVTKEYFVIELSEGQANDISIQWLAILAEQTNEDRVEVLETNGDGSEQNEEPSEQTDSDDGVQTEQSNVQTTKQNTEQNGVVEPTPTPVPTQETNYQTTQESENLNNTASSSAETTHSGEVVE